MVYFDQSLDTRSHVRYVLRIQRLQQKTSDFKIESPSLPHILSKSMRPISLRTTANPSSSLMASMTTTEITARAGMLR